MRKPATTIDIDKDLLDKLKELSVEESLFPKFSDVLGVTTVADLSALNENDLVGIGLKLVPARNFVKAMAPAPTPTTVTGQPSFDMLPQVPDDTSFLEMLKVGGVLKIQPVDVISATRAALASKLGLFDLPDILAEKMERFAQEQDEPVGSEFYTLQKMITTRRYAEVLSALDVSSSFVTEKRKKETLRRLDERLWPALQGFHGSLKGWMDTWMAGAANPAMMISMIAMAQSGGGAALPPGMMSPPDTNTIRAEAEGVINKINSVFAGTGIPVARALAADASRIRAALEQPGLPATVGAANRDQMLKMLNVSVGPDYVRLEKNIIRYTMAVMELQNVTAGNEEISYLGAMFMLGNQISWDKLDASGNGITGIGGGRTL